MEELGRVNGDTTDANFDSYFTRAQFREAVFTLKNKFEMVRDEQRLKTTVVKVRPLEGDQLGKEIKTMIEGIKKYLK
jgi:hypothetical protein